MFRPTLLGALAALASLGASYRSENFVVEAPTAELAERVARHAEHHRQDQAMLWLGKKMPAWPKPCPVVVTVTDTGSGGATSFAFDRGQILSIDMHIEGTVEQMLTSVLPHEVTHTVFAQRFRCPVPRWADEGGAVLSEDAVERNRHEAIARQILDTPGRAIPLRRLFQLRDYPRDVMVLFVEGYSVTRLLIAAKDRATFLAFVKQGMDGNHWDEAALEHYGFDNVEVLEQAWMKDLRQPPRKPKEAKAERPRQVFPAPAARPTDDPFSEPVRPATAPADKEDRDRKKSKALQTALLKALQDKDAEVRKNAASALESMGGEVVPPLIKALESKEALLRDGALAVLASMAEAGEVPEVEEALPTLTRLLEDRDVAVRRGAARLIVRILKKQKKVRLNPLNEVMDPF